MSKRISNGSKHRHVKKASAIFVHLVWPVYARIHQAARQNENRNRKFRQSLRRHHGIRRSPSGSLMALENTERRWRAMPAKGTITGRAAHNFKPIAPGTRIHSLTVIGYAGSRLSSSGKRKAWFNCRCECGATKQILATHLRQGRVKSCSCYRRHLQSLKCKAALSLLASIDFSPSNK